MDRLTHKSPGTDMVWFVDHENNNALLEPCEMNSHHIRLAVQKLGKYEDAEEKRAILNDEKYAEEDGMTIEEKIIEEREIERSRLYASKKAEERFIETETQEIFKKKMLKEAREHKQFAEWLEEFKQYKEAEEQGLLLKLPCKVGMRIWVNGILGVGEVEEYEVIRVDYHSTLGTGKNEFYIEALLVKNPKNSIGFYDKEFDKNVFLTKDEAEKSLVESVK